MVPYVKWEYFSFTATLAWSIFFFVVLLILIAAFKKAKNPQKILWNILAVTIILRILYAWIVGKQGLILDNDAFYYRAVTLYQNHGFLNAYGNPTALWLPGYSILLAIVFKILGNPSYFACFFTQILLGLAIMGITYGLARTLSNKTASLCAAVIVGLFPSQIILETIVQSDLFFEVSLWAGLLFYAYAFSRKEKRYPWVFLLLSGLLFAFASLTRPYGLVFVVAYFLLLVISTVGAMEKFKKQIIYLLPIAIVIILLHGIWIVRNEKIFHRFLPFTSGAGINLWVANHPGSSGHFDYLPSEFYALKTPAEEMKIDDKFKNEAIRYIEQNPREFLVKIPKKWIFLWSSDSTLLGQVLSQMKMQNNFLKNFAAGLVNGYYLTFLLLAFIFVVRNFKTLLNDHVGSFGIVMFLSLLAIFSVYHVETRFHIPLIPALALYGAFFITESKHVRPAFVQEAQGPNPKDRPTSSPYPWPAKPTF